jgi:hypothetical protein
VLVVVLSSCSEGRERKRSADTITSATNRVSEVKKAGSDKSKHTARGKGIFFHKAAVAFSPKGGGPSVIAQANSFLVEEQWPTV